ncbi:hypothetical protein JB92DRAFT_1110667 [Gautieria morchelliformis]|nr:hypothetical protein JB92DRAFT_1110667 [Gautieria morchelliformis]
MIAVPQSSPTPEWILPATSNNCEARLPGRKRGHDEVCEETQELMVMGTRRPNKKPKLECSFRDVSNTSNACIDSRAPHEFLAGAGDWKFEPLVDHTLVLEEESQQDDPLDPKPSSDTVDVDKVIAILLEAMKPSNQRMYSPEPSDRSYQRGPTSPLSDSSHRTPFVRKSVGGPCRGRTDPGLRRWVVSKNHIEDIRSRHPSLRSSEWVEALHEMGWEHLHPTYMSQSQQTTGVFDEAC